MLESYAKGAREVCTRERVLFGVAKQCAFLLNNLTHGRGLPHPLSCDTSDAVNTPFALHAAISICCDAGGTAAAPDLQYSALLLS